MGNEEGKVSPGLLFGAAFVLFIAAIVLYITKEDSAYTKTAEAVQSQEAVVSRIETSYQSVLKQLEAIREAQGLEQDFRDKITHRMEYLEMKVNAQPRAVVHKDAPIPQPLKVEISQPIQFVPVPKATPKKVQKK